MSTCISQHGEYSAHTPDGHYTCTMCGAQDVDALLAEVERLRAPNVEHGVGGRSE